MEEPQDVAIVEREEEEEEQKEKEEPKRELAFPYWAACRRRYVPDHPFFSSGDAERELLAKQIALDLAEGDGRALEGTDERGMFCPIVGCGARLNSLEDFEDHYLARHTASCSVCGRVYPTSRLLSIHVSETHDSFFQAKVARGFPMYECLVEGCGVKLKTYQSRQQHLIDKHKFPTSFEFLKKKHLSKQQRQHHHRRAAKKIESDTTSDHAKSESAVVDMEMEGNVAELASAVSRLSTADASSPSNVSFGRRHSRGLAFIPRSIQQQRKSGISANRKRHLNTRNVFGA
ncbi:uncharacterized protein LOC116247159 isoform X2 [Nymphaea colorata]|uniref:uncharacterized protein LOC116247159 isoform X2 n=1 Tax=Nymphaea colorata TaxID=210225 RepID=UPI00129E529B|nr:uncharacterized protein LOC116247159 isoform X2 [Nymphaea colorata]